MTIDVARLASQAVNLAFTQLSALIEDITLTNTEGSVYDAVSGSTTSTQVANNIGGIFVEINKYDGRFAPQSDIEGDAVQVGDRNLLVKAVEITLSVSTDTLVRRSKDGTEWRIVNYKLDPTESLYELHVRKTS